MGLKKNVIYSSVLNIANYIFQFITFPYVSRVLGPYGIGIYQFVTTIVQYFMMIVYLGAIYLGTREIAKCRSVAERNQVFSKILLTNIIIMSVSLAVYLSLIFLVPSFREVREYLFVGILQVVFNALMLEWLFRGMQEFRYITIRTVLVRVLYVGAVFILVGNPGDVMLYYVLSVLIVVVNGLINWFYSGKFVHYTWPGLIESVRSYFKPMALLCSQSLISFFYFGYNTVYLGSIYGDEQVGYFTIATKILVILGGLYTAYSIALMPKMSQVTAIGNKKEEQRLIKSSIELVCGFSIPMIVILCIYASSIVEVVAGSGFDPSIDILRIGTPLVLILGLNQILFMQIMIPTRMDKQVSISCLVGAGLGISLNFLLVGYCGMQALGSIIIWLGCECMVLLCALFNLRNLYCVGSWLRIVVKYILGYVPLFLIVITIKAFPINDYAGLSLGLVVVIAYIHFLLAYIFRQEQYVGFVKCTLHVRS